VKSESDKAEKRPIRKATKMLKKITTEIKAAVMLIIAENLTTLRTLFKNVTNSVSKSIGKHQDAIWQNEKKP